VDWRDCFVALHVHISSRSARRQQKDLRIRVTSVENSKLVERIVNGDERALAELYEIYRGMLYSMLLRILNDTGTTEEVLQDLFLQVWQRPWQFDQSRGSLTRWLVVIGRSRALSRLRRKRRWELLEAPAEFSIETLPVSGSLEDKTVSVLLAERLRNAMGSLPPLQKEAIELAYFEGMTQAEIALKTGSPLGTVKSRVRVAVATLKQLFEKESSLAMRAAQAQP
jgi:RNA polymerase sigma-70 factor, ECF subfamily